MLLVTGLMMVSLLIVPVPNSRLVSSVAGSPKADFGLLAFCFLGIALLGVAFLGAIFLGAAGASRLVMPEEPVLVAVLLLRTLRAFSVSLLVVTIVRWCDEWSSLVQNGVDVRLCRSKLCCFVSLESMRVHLVRIVHRERTETTYHHRGLVLFW